MGGRRTRCAASPRARAPLGFCRPPTPQRRARPGALEPKGTLVVDAGATKALRGGASLLPIGVTSCEGAFRRGDAVVVRTLEGIELGRGLVAYDSDEAVQIIRRSSRGMEAILGYPGRAEMIHRDDLALAPGAPQPASAPVP